MENRIYLTHNYYWASSEENKKICLFCSKKREGTPSKQVMRRSAFVLAILVASLSLVRADVILGSSFVAIGTQTIAEEGVSFSVNIYSDGTNGRFARVYSTPNGYYGTYQIANLKNLTYGRYYFTYHIDNVPICYSGYATIPAPLPPTDATAGYAFNKLGVMNNIETSVLVGDVPNSKYPRRAYVQTNYSSVSSNSPFLLAFFSKEAMAQSMMMQVYNNRVPDPSVFTLPAACSSSSVMELAQHQMEAIRNAELEKGFAGLSRRFSLPLRPEDFEGVVKAASTIVGRQISPFRPRSAKSLDVSAVDNSRFTTPIRDQGDCGGCWAFSSAALAEAVYYFAKNASAPQSTSAWLSVQSLLDCATGNLNGSALFPSKGCLGGWPLVALAHMIKQGAQPELSYTFDGVNGVQCLQQTSKSVHVISTASYLPLENGPVVNEQLLRAAVVENGAVIAIMNANNILFYTGGIFSATCPASLGHAVLLVGFGVQQNSDGTSTNYWVVKNSFGAAWGEGGFFRIVRGINLCGIEQMGFVATAS